MSQAFAPRSPRGFSWVLLAICGLLAEGTAFGQGDATKKAATPPSTGAKPADPADAKDADDSDDDQAKVERFVDPNAKSALAIIKPIPYTGRPIRVPGVSTDPNRPPSGPSDLTRVQNMVARLENEDPAFIKSYIEYFAAELTKRDNINAIMAPPANMSPTAPQARGLERAVDALTRPIVDARANNNTSFLTSYTKALFDSSLPKLLDNNYFARINAMIVLGMAGSPSSTALDFYASQLKIPDQLIWVKVWAAKGYTNAAQEGKANLDALRALNGAAALIEFLNSDPKLPYFAQVRALEALGSIRVATINRPDLKLDVASVVAGYLVDPAARPETRAWAAWALGMMRVAQQVAPYNFALAGYEVGDLAATLGSEIVAEYDEHAQNFEDNNVQATSLTALLLFQIVPAVAGEESVPESGLLRSPHPNAGPAKSFLTRTDEKIKALTREAYELLRAGGVNQKGKRDDLNAKVVDLRTFLTQNKPKERQLVPGGPNLPVNDAQVAAGRP